MSDTGPYGHDFRYVTLPEVVHMVGTLADLVRARNFAPDLILAITPGGSIIGELLSYYSSRAHRFQW